MTKVPWHFTVSDRKTISVSLLIMLLPLFIFLQMWAINDKQQKRLFASNTASDLIYDVEVMFDHLNGALINLSASFSACTTETVNQMYRYAFDIPGVEGFLIINEQRSVICSNWHPDQSIEVELPASFGLSLSKEHFLRSVGKNGFFAYRTGANGLTYIAVVSATHLRYLLNQRNIALTDALALLDNDEENPLSLSGLLSNTVLQQARLAFASDDKKTIVEIDDFSITLISSDQHPNLSVAYLYRTPTIMVTLSDHKTEIILLLVGQLFAFILWLTHRFKKLNSMKVQLTMAIDRQEFTPYLQPIVDINTQAWVGAEMLARWQRHGQDVAYPNEFIPLAEKHSLIKKITKQLAQKAFSFYQDHPELVSDFFLSINLSPNHIDEKTISSLHQLRKSYPSIQVSQIKLEITEQGLGTEKAQNTKQIIEQLRQMGCQVGLDDFGTGQSGLEYFTHLTFDFIKIDQRFVGAIGKTNVDFHLLKTIIQLAASLKLDVIAEGVETEQQAEWLAAQGVRYAQGWLYAKAMPLSEFKKNLIHKKAVTL